MANQETGSTECGAGVFTAIGTGSGLVLFPPQAPGTDIRTNYTYPTLTFHSANGRGSLGIVLSAACNQAFNLDYQFTPDGGTTWYNGGQLASSTVTVDGGAAGFTQAASINLQVGYQYRVMLYNNSGSTLAGAYEWRLYSDNA